MFIIKDIPYFSNNTMISYVWLACFNDIIWFNYYM